VFALGLPSGLHQPLQDLRGGKRTQCQSNVGDASSLIRSSEVLLRDKYSGAPVDRGGSAADELCHAKRPRCRSVPPSVALKNKVACWFWRGRCGSVLSRCPSGGSINPPDMSRCSRCLSPPTESLCRTVAVEIIIMFIFS